LADHYRKKAKQGSKITNSEDVLLAISDKSQNPHQDVIDNEQLQHLYQNLQQLPQNYQEVLTLRYIEGLSSLEIAKIIGKNDAATRKQLSRAVAALAKKSKNYRENNI
jgi:RNA polymerase sigma-70 factor (ECF subfamily)